jgi:hypothetical protein
MWIDVVKKIHVAQQPLRRRAKIVANSNRSFVQATGCFQIQQYGLAAKKMRFHYAARIQMAVVERFDAG